MTTNKPSLTEADIAEIKSTVRDAILRVINTEVEIPDRTHAPEFEQAAWNQMPKTGARDLRLFRYDGTDLYAWYGKKGENSSASNWSAFEDALTEPFRIIVRN